MTIKTIDKSPRQPGLKRHHSLALLLLISIHLTSAAFGEETAVRGRIEFTFGRGENLPAKYLQIQLKNDRGDSHSTISGSDGFYYFDDIEPGEYDIEVSLADGKNLGTYTIDIPDVELFDVPPIHLEGKGRIYALQILTDPDEGDVAVTTSNSIYIFSEKSRLFYKYKNIPFMTIPASSGRCFIYRKEKDKGGKKTSRWIATLSVKLVQGEAVSVGKLYMTPMILEDSKEGQYQKRNTAGSPDTNISVARLVPGRYSTISCDNTDGQIYAADQARGIVVRLDIDREQEDLSEEKVMAGLSEPTTLLVHDGIIYVGESGSDVIKSKRLPDGPEKRIELNRGNPTSFALSVTGEGLLVATTNPRKIVMIEKHSQTIVEIFDLDETPIREAASMAVDHDGGIWMVDAAKATVFRLKEGVVKEFRSID